MPARSEPLMVRGALALLVCLTVTGYASAYTLPAPEFIGQFLALAGWALLALGSMLMYPIYALMRWLRGSRIDKPVETTAETTAETAAPATPPSHEQG